MTGGAAQKLFFSEVTIVLSYTRISIKVHVNRKLLPILFQYGDVFPTETEYWIESGILFLHSSSHLSLEIIWQLTILVLIDHQTY